MKALCPHSVIRVLRHLTPKSVPFPPTHAVLFQDPGYSGWTGFLSYRDIRADVPVNQGVLCFREQLT